LRFKLPGSSSSSDDSADAASGRRVRFDEAARVNKATARYAKNLRMRARAARAAALGSDAGRWMLEPPPRVEVSARALRLVRVAAQALEGEQRGRRVAGRGSEEGEGCSVLSLRRFRRLAGVEEGSASDDSPAGLVAVDAAVGLPLVDAARLLGWNGAGAAHWRQLAAPALSKALGKRYRLD
jgi:hypothetical protein